MRNIIVFTILLFLGMACSKDSNKDHQAPLIDASFEQAFPIQCSEIRRGETFQLKARFLDDKELGSFGIDIHNNFDQHSHSTESGSCLSDTIQIAVNPFVYIHNFEIPTGLTSYEAAVDIEVPAAVDVGDYHLMIRVTDKAGWESLKGLSIQIVD